MERVVEIASDGLYLALYRGFLKVTKDGSEIGRIALDDIGALVVHGHGITWSNNIFAALSNRKVPVVICGSNHAPISIVWPLQGFHAQGARMAAQIAASRPLQKRLWAQIIKSKILMQQATLAACNKSYNELGFMAKKIRSGDPENIEAQAARRYWKLLFGNKFRRDQNGDGANALLNYGYTILRALTSRTICAAGLHPTIGIFHSNRSNAFALADDLMEPFRPLIDMIVYNLVNDNHLELDRDSKQLLNSFTTFDLQGNAGTSPFFIIMQQFVHSIAMSFEKGEALALLPTPPKVDELCLLGKYQREQ